MSAFSRITSLTVVVLIVVSLLGGSAPAQSGPYGVVSPTTVNFGQVLVGQTSPQQRVRLKNTGNSELIVSSISISGYFALPVNHCASGVQPGTHCDVYVTFTPHALETETGTLTFVDNASNSPQTVSLTGVGATTVPTKTTVTASPKSIYAGQPITFTATVTSLGGGVIPDGEQVYFETSYTGLGYGTLQSGVATLTTTNCRGIGQQTQNVKAQYAGDQSFYPSYGSVDITVQKWPITVTLTSNPNPSIYNDEPVTFTAQVTSNSPVAPTGNIYFSGFYLTYALMQNGIATITAKSNKGVGSYAEYADFHGDPYNSPGQATLTQVVNPTTTTTSIKSSRNPSVQGQAVTFSVIVKAPWAHVVDGSVTFTSGSNTLGTVQLSNSRGSITTSSLPVGQDTITVTYTPANGNFLGSSGSLVQTVN
jgi:hypothetical protein